MHGAPTEAAKCNGPVSLPIASRALDAIAATSKMVVGVSKTWDATPRVGLRVGRSVLIALWSGISQADQPAKGKQAAPGF